MLGEPSAGYSGCRVSAFKTRSICADTLMRRDEKLLEKYGLKANDAILAEEKHMGLYDDLIQNHKAVLIAGGAAQNTARGAQV
jgi:hypothetical protein